MVLVKTFYAFNDLRNFTYLVLNDQTQECWVIDPYEAGPIIDYIKKNGIKLKGILNTHQHFDHIRGNAPLREAFHAPVQKLNNSQTLELNADYSLKSLGTPGHTLDHQAFVWTHGDEPLALFSGDTLFNSGVGNCKGGGDVNLLYETTEKLISSLPDSTLLYPGHDYRKRNLEFALHVEPENKLIKESLYGLTQVETFLLPPVTLGEEKKVNPFLRLHSDEIRGSVALEKPNEKEIFIKLRKLRDQW